MRKTGRQSYLILEYFQVYVTQETAGWCRST